MALLFVAAAGTLAYAARRSHLRVTAKRNTLAGSFEHAPRAERGRVVEVPNRPNKHIYYCDFSNDRRGAVIIKIQRREKKKWTDDKGKEHKYYEDRTLEQYLSHEPSYDITNDTVYSDEHPDAEIPLQRASKTSDPMVACTIRSNMSEEYKFNEKLFNWDAYAHLHRMGIGSSMRNKNSETRKDFEEAVATLPTSYLEGHRISRLYIYGPLRVHETRPMDKTSEIIQITPEVVSDDLNLLLDKIDWEQNYSVVYGFLAAICLFVAVMDYVRQLEDAEKEARRIEESKRFADDMDRIRRAAPAPVNPAPAPVKPALTPAKTAPPAPANAEDGVSDLVKALRKVL